MSDLRALIRLKEKELRCLEWSLMAQKAQEAAGAFVPETLREELEDRKAEQQVGQSSNRDIFFIFFQIIQSQGEMSKREQDVGLLWQTRFKSGCPTWEITHLPKQNPSRPRRIFWFRKVLCWAVLSPQHRFILRHTPLSLSDEKELNSHFRLTQLSVYYFTCKVSQALHQLLCLWVKIFIKNLLLLLLSIDF